MPKKLLRVRNPESDTVSSKKRAKRSLQKTPVPSAVSSTIPKESLRQQNEIQPQQEDHSGNGGVPDQDPLTRLFGPPLSEIEVEPLGNPEDCYLLHPSQVWIEESHDDQWIHLDEEYVE